MDFIWDEAKNERLKQQRFISFEQITAAIQQYDFLDIIENPSKEGQYCFIMRIRDYTWVVPFVFDKEDRIVLKTAYPSRKYHRIYGGKRQP